MARDLIADLLALFSPRAAYQRVAWRQGYDALSGIAERSYAAARRGRLSNDWFANGGSADATLMRDLVTLRDRQRQMVRDDPNAAAAKRQLVTHLVGDGITAQAVHADDSVASDAQDLWDAWANSPVDGRDDFYGVQKQGVGGMIDGDVVLKWSPLGGVPDTLLQVLEGDFLDNRRNQLLPNGGKIVQGVEFDQIGLIVAYWLFRYHPGDVFGWRGGAIGMSERIEARDIDHMFEALRPGQARGVPWFYAGLQTLRDISEIEQSIQVKKRVEACLSVFRKPGEATGSQLGEQKTNPGTSNFETLRPGMIIQGQPGESIDVINPSSSGDGDGFLRGRKMNAAAAIGVPYHLMTGDVSQANYSSLRADIVPFYERLDDVTFNVIVPRLCNPAFARRMRVEALRLGRPELLQVTAEWTPAPRPWVDPLKEMTAEKMEIRSMPGEIVRAFTRRGRNWRKEFKIQAEVNALMDQYRIVSDTDARRIDGMGQIQAAAPYLSKGNAQPEDEPPPPPVARPN